MSHYDTLEVSAKASPAVIRAAYRSLMQRYHPDKNPADSAAAAQAVLVQQAYAVLADENQRSAYDAQLTAQATGLTVDRRQAVGADMSVAFLRAARHDEASNNRKLHWIIWLLIVATILSCLWLITHWLSLKSPEVELSELQLSIDDDRLSRGQMIAKMTRRDEILARHPELLANERMKEEAARTLPFFLTDLRINLGAGDPETGELALTIPTLAVRVGSFDAYKMKRYVMENRAIIRGKLEAKLVTAKPQELAKATGETYLRELILAAINEATGSNRAEKYPASVSENPGRYGVVEALLPNAFTVKAFEENR